MTDLERAMLAAQHEIRSLRTANADMAGKLEIVELFQRIIMPRGPQGMAEDVVWLLQRQIDALKKADPAPKSTEAPSDGN
jgi:hypothetical protein